MHKIGKMRPVETVLRMEGERIKGNDGGVNLYFCKCHNVLPEQQ
jgi:hypothetical protein